MSRKNNLLKDLKNNLFSDGRPFTLNGKELHIGYAKIKETYNDILNMSDSIIYRVDKFEEALSNVVNGPTKGIRRQLNLFKLCLAYEMLRFELEA